MTTTNRDAGLQPERTSLAWGRTMTALVGASLLFLRWVPAHGWFAGTLVFTALAAALGIYLSQRVRYARSVAGVIRGRLQADVAAVLCTSGAVLALGGLGIYTVLFLPL
ncbi:uncharacterized membrane protein YidH (DUF202 family) [Arthrobacter pigmenti]|uniref:Uncharacterized membrane protein YidH (DUF202 family) n=1 Tax=Arthrobacter pigmenti TaxID=271432 RepID=A0A846RJP3_9MICC|nr:DUF202 domain-containing protein [Arthrobacter pigmenti]NJC21369.1 uncharacterized membrane protein YidH (DUF202 family) [Arthrobacter pigmenti]